jgi:hypothetical protein
MVWIGSIWLRIGTSGGLLWTRLWTFGFHKTLGSSWVAAQLAASQEGLSSMSRWWVRFFFIQGIQVQDFLWSFETSPTPNLQAGGPLLFGCPKLLIQYISSYSPYLEVVSSIRNLRTRHAVVTRDPPNIRNLRTRYAVVTRDPPKAERRKA